MTSPTDTAPHVPSPVLADPSPTFTHSGITVASHHRGLLPALAPLLFAGFALFGFRALAVVGIVLASTTAGILLLRLVGQRGKCLDLSHGLLLATLLACLLPAELAFPAPFDLRLSPPTAGGAQGGYALAAAAGLTLAFVYWILGGVGSRIHPVAVAGLVLLLAFPTQLQPTSVLVRPNLFTGDLRHAAPGTVDPTTLSDPLLFSRAHPNDPPALRIDPASLALTTYTAPAARAPTSPGTTSAHGGSTPGSAGGPAGSSAGGPVGVQVGGPVGGLVGGWLSLDALLRDKLPPLEDLVLGGHPAPLGLGSLAAVLLGGLLLLYLGGADWRIPLVALLSAFAAFLCLKLPVVVTDAGPVYRWLAFREPGVTWEALATFAFYQIAAGPLVFTAFFLATSGASCPTRRNARLLYAALLGLLSATAQLYISVPTGPLFALLLVSFLTPPLERALRPKPLL